jgi:hypothetical protein
MFGSLFNLASDVVRIAVAPVELVAEVVSVPVKIVADVTGEIVNEVKSLKDL